MVQQLTFYIYTTSQAKRASLPFQISCQPPPGILDGVEDSGSELRLPGIFIQVNQLCRLGEKQAGWLSDADKQMAWAQVK